jgi:oligopeptide transport system ATP-binding protein
VETIYQIKNLTKEYPVSSEGFFTRKRKYFNAVDDVSFDINKGETFGVVGESGSGKTTLARMLLRLIEPTKGGMFYKGCDITTLNFRDMKKMRRRMQMIFQDPFSSLDPRKTVQQIIAEPLRIHKLGTEKEIKEKVKQTLDLVDLPATDDLLSKIPEELSGGQRQRIGIARALTINPDFVIADEPVSMLDASVKAGIIALMMELKDKIDLTYVFITHEIALAYHICDRIAVMYLGELVEMGDTESIIRTPSHPYTKLLIESVPPLVPDEEWTNKSFGTSTLTRNPFGCKFHERCPEVSDACRKERPQLREVKSEHYSACWLTRV